MKLKYTTTLFILVNLIVTAFRTVQVLILTEAGTGFLKSNALGWNIAGMVFSVLALAALFFNSVRAVRQPETINLKGAPSMVMLAAVGIMYACGAAFSLIEKQIGYKIEILLLLLAAFSAFIILISALCRLQLPKICALSFIAYWLVKFALAYLHYTEKPLRVRTVYETLAICFVILFSVAFGKAFSGVKSERNFRLLYPFGLIASSLCIVSVIPEFIAFITGQGDKITELAVSPIVLVAAAVFTGFVTINTFKKSNTIHPKQKLRAQAKAHADLGTEVEIGVTNDENTNM